MKNAPSTWLERAQCPSANSAKQQSSSNSNNNNLTLGRLIVCLRNRALVVPWIQEEIAWSVQRANKSHRESHCAPAGCLLCHRVMAAPSSCDPRRVYHSARPNENIRQFIPFRPLWSGARQPRSAGQAHKATRFVPTAEWFNANAEFKRQQQQQR